jgi:hypothetical protein
MTSNTRRMRMAAGFILTVGSAAPAWAQWGASTYGVAEYDTKSTLLLLAGLRASSGGPGIGPVLGVQAYHLSYDNGGTAGGRTTVLSVKPYVGLHNNFTGGSVSGTVGYAFADKDIPASTVATDVGKGVVLAGGLDYWGTGGPLAYQALGSYNFGSEFLWARGRVTTRMSQSNDGTSRVGAEVAFLKGENFDAIQPGGVFEWRKPNGLGFGIGAGVKILDGSTPVYFKVEGSLPLTR